MHLYQLKNNRIVNIEQMIELIVSREVNALSFATMRMTDGSVFNLDEDDTRNILDLCDGAHFLTPEDYKIK